MNLRRTSLVLCILPLSAACTLHDPEPGGTTNSAGQGGGSPEAGPHISQLAGSGAGGSRASQSATPTTRGAGGQGSVDKAGPATVEAGILAPDAGAGSIADAGQPTVSAEAPDAPLTASPSELLTLNHVDSCAELNELLRARARTRMNADLDALKAQVLSDAGTRSWCYVNSTVSGSSGGIAMAGGATAPAAESAKGASAPTSVSETNNQVVGVDEADLIKTDGKFLYLTQGSELRIVSAWPADQTQAVSTLGLGGTAKKLLLHGDRLIAFVSLPRASNAQSPWMSRSGKDCTYGYDCDFSGDGTATALVIIDVTNRASPKVLRRLNFSGSLIAARSLGATVHAVVSIGGLEVPNLVTPSLGGFCGARVMLPDGGSTPSAEQQTAALSTIEQARAANNKLIDAAKFDFGSIAQEGQSSVGAADCGDFYREPAGDGSGLTTVVSLDLEALGAPTLANIVSRGGAVYASTESLYISVSHQRTQMRFWYGGQVGEEASTVHQFRIGQTPSETSYLGSGIVPGRVLNQFSMDEYAGHLRIATTNGHVPDPNVASTLSVMKLRGSSLDVVGQVGGIAPTEDIRSVRFDGERGYLVSFKKTDPLFVLDLTTPTKPAVVGELKIPGFSTYMHRLDAGHLLALGYEADDQGSFAYFNGLQLQIFDVTNPTQPTLLHKKVYGTRGTSSSALTDHLGFTFLRDRGLLTLPMSICDGGGNGQYGKLAFSGVVAMRASVADGFVELGRLEEPYSTSAQSNGFRYGGACQDWWTDSNSVVTRTVVLDDFLYAISANRVRVQNLNRLGTDVRVVDFSAADASP